MLYGLDPLKYFVPGEISFSIGRPSDKQSSGDEVLPLPTIELTIGYTGFSQKVSLGY